MDEPSETSERFEEHRGHLWTVAYRMLGSLDEADDAVQEAWLGILLLREAAGARSRRRPHAGGLPVGAGVLADRSCWIRVSAERVPACQRSPY